jgi:hypothetical protein
MGYKHLFVTKALEDMEQMMANNNNHIGDVPSAFAFADEVCKVLRTKKCRRNTSSYWLYRDDCPYVLGWVGHGNYRADRKGEKMYTVYASTIENNKYSEWRDQYYMRMSINKDTAIRNAKKYMRVMLPRDLAGIRVREATYAVDKVLSEAKTEFNEAKDAVIDVGTSLNSVESFCNSVLIQELSHLVKLDHQFLDSGFKDRLSTLFEKQDRLIDLKNRSVPLWFVYVYERMGRQVFDVVGINNAQSTWEFTIDPHSTRYLDTELPEDIMQKLSVLNMIPDDDYVDGVGFNAGEGMFYVTR